MFVPTALTLERVPLHKQIYARALLDMGTSTRSVAEECSIGLSTVQAIKHKQDYSEQFLESVKRKLPTAFYALGGLAMSKVSEEKLDACSAPQLMIVAGVAVDKARDMEGSNRPVVNIVTMVGDITRGMNDLRSKQAALMELRA